MSRFRIREIAESQGLDAAKLARRADLNYATVARLWKNADTDAGDVFYGTLVSIAKALNVTVDDLFANTANS